MRLASHVAIASGLVILPPLTMALTLDCEKIRVNGVNFDLGPLAGMHSVTHARRTVTGDIKNTTFTFDLCDNLSMKGDPNKRCPMGTRICASERLYTDHTEGEVDPDDVWPIAGDFSVSHGRHLDPYVERLKDSKSNTDSRKEGLRIELKGGLHEGEPQRAFIELICDRDKTGLEGLGEDTRKQRRADEKPSEGGSEDGNNDDSDSGEEGDDGDDNDGDGLDDGEELPQPEGPLQFVSYGHDVVNSKVTGTLRMTWDTKYACEDEAGKEKPDDGNNSSAGWGFFTWFILLAFLAMAGYLVFGAWLNYNRYGARGWDLLPHGDTIRDIPYILKDWGRRVLGMMQGGGRDLGSYSGIRM